LIDYSLVLVAVVPDVVVVWLDVVCPAVVVVTIIPVVVRLAIGVVVRGG
jgi:hypothetical protein